MDKRAGTFLELCVTRYKNNPNLFVEEVIGAIPTEQQRGAMDALSNGKKKVAVKSGHGT